MLWRLGAKGGGKTHIVRIKAIGAALYGYPGIKILIMRKTYNEVFENHIRPMLTMVDPSIYSYNGTTHLMTFENGSSIKFGHWAGEQSENEYNGLEYDWIFIDEATQFTERTFDFLGGCLRGTNNIPKRMYLTCNPGGVGHFWVKRLFIDRKYKVSDNPEESENPDNYTFIFATVEDNKWLLESSPMYLHNLSKMPEDKRAAYRYGDWDAIGGNYFPEFKRATHTCKPFRIPPHWTRYRSFDYGLDRFACFWWAVDEDGRCWAYRYYEAERLITQDAAKKVMDNTLPSEKVMATYVPPDMWNKQKDTGRTMAEIFLTNGVNAIKSSNNRVQGHMMMKEMMAPLPCRDKYVHQIYGDQCPDMLPGLMIFNNIDKPISDLESIQASDDDPNDCSKEPHDITHSVDAIRYFAITRVLPAEEEKKAEAEEEDDTATDYGEYICGGEATQEYMV